MHDPGEFSGGQRRESPPPGEKGRGFRSLILHELLELLPAWMFFFLLFSLLWMTEHVLLAEHHLKGRSLSRVVIGSFIVAKGLLLADLIPGVKRLDRAAVMSAAAGKTLVYAVVVLLIQYVEQLFDLRHQGLASAGRAFGHRLGTAEFWGLEIWLICSLFAFSATKEVFQTLGRDRFLRLLFGSRAGSKAPPAE